MSSYAAVANLAEARAENQAKALGQAAYRTGMARDPKEIPEVMDVLSADPVLEARLIRAYRFGYDQAAS